MVLSCISRNPSRTVPEIAKMAGISSSATLRHLTALNKQKKIVLLKSGKKFMYVLPSDGQKVFKHRVK